MMKPNAHHLVMGELTDVITGEVRPDTHDERYRQNIAQRLIHSGEYDKSDIQVWQPLTIDNRGNIARIRIDFLIGVTSHTAMMIRYAPGSLVTRRLPNLALSRLIQPYQIPIIVSTNGEDAEVINGLDGTVLGQGMGAIYSKSRLMEIDHVFDYPLISSDLRDKAARIAYACEVDGACPCDTDICTMPSAKDSGQ